MNNDIGRAECPQSPILPRERVTSALAEAVAAYPLTVLTAPMGYGKTTAARQLADALLSGEKKEAAVARAYFVTLPPEPYSAPYLWNFIWGRLAAQGLEFAESVKAYGFPGDAERRQHVFARCRALAERVLLVLDDYHWVADPDMDAYLTALTREGIAGLHILLLSRSRPNLPLEELRLKSLAESFDQTLLAFSEAETGALFARYGNKDAETARRARLFSEGWPAALWLCLRNPESREDFSGAPLARMEAMLEESIFSAYAPEDRRLLLQLSLLDHYTAREADDIGGPGSRERLQQLHRNNSFIRFDPATNSYVPHSIFGAFLAKRLPSARDIDQAALCRRVAECHIGREELISALRFLVRAGRDEDKLRLLELFALPGGNLLLFFFADEVMEAVQAIAWPLREKRPLEYLAFLYFCLAEAHDLRAVTLLEEAEERFARAGDIAAPLKRRLAAEALLIRNILAFNDLWAMRDIHEEAHGLLHGRSAIASRRMIWTFACPHSAYLYLREPGTYRDMITLIEGNLHYFHELTDGCSLGAQPLFRAEWLLERGEFDDVEGLLAASARLAESKDQATTLLNAAFTRARLYLATDRGEEALALMRDCRPRVDALGHVDLSTCLDLALGYISACLGHAEAIPAWLREGDFGPARSIPQIFGFIQFTHAKAALLAGDSARLESIAKSIPEYLGPFDNLFARIQAKALEAIAAHRLYGPEKGGVLLGEALDLARPDGILLSLAEYGPHLLPLLPCPPPSPASREHKPDAYLAALAGLAGRYPRTSREEADGGRGPMWLTPRQKDVLALASQGLRNAEIAAALNVSPETVKKILSAVYKRLGATNRAEAVCKFTGRR